MGCTRSESTEIPWCEPLDEPDLTIGTILVNGYRTVLSTCVYTCGLSTIRNFTRKLTYHFYLRSIAEILAAVFSHKEIANLQIYGRTLENKYFRLRLMYFLFVRCVFFGKG